MNDFEALIQDLLKRKKVIAHRITSHFSEVNNENFEESVGQLAFRFRVELIEIIALSLIEKTQAELKISEWASRVAKVAIDYGFPMEDTLKTAQYYRTFIWEEIKAFSLKNDLPISSLWIQCHRSIQSWTKPYICLV